MRLFWRFRKYASGFAKRLWHDYVSGKVIDF